MCDEDSHAQMKRQPNRRYAISQQSGNFLVTVGFDPETHEPREIFLDKLDRFDGDLADILIDLGRAASFIMQGRKR